MKKYIYLTLLILVIIISFVFIILKKNKNEIIDISGEYIDEVNESIELIENNLKSKGIPYEVKKSKNTEIYSLVIISEQDTEKSFMTFNIDLKTKLYLNNKEIAEMFGYSLDDIFNKIDERLKQYYNEEVKEGWVDSNECDFECYKASYRNIEFVENNYALYVENNKLYIYISFDSNSVVEDKKYFDNLKYDPYKIEV